jgi:TPR repeat protein
MEQMETTMTRLLRAAMAALMLVALAGAAVAWPDKEDAARDARVAAIRVEAEQGDATAQVEVGLMYYIGDHVPQDYAETVKWYQLAADQGLYPAQLSLARMYEDGRGVPQDIVRAHMWVNLCAAHGGRIPCADIRNDYERRMTPAQVAEAQKLSREWKPTSGLKSKLQN